MVISLNVIEEEQGDVTILRLEGRLDAATTPNLESRFSNLNKSQKKKILMDFTKIDYLSSAGMRLLLATTKKLKSESGILAFCGINDDVMEIIKMAGFERILNIYSTEKLALDTF